MPGNTSSYLTLAGSDHTPSGVTKRVDLRTRLGLRELTEQAGAFPERSVGGQTDKRATGQRSHPMPGALFTSHTLSKSRAHILDTRLSVLPRDGSHVAAHVVEISAVLVLAPPKPLRGAAEPCALPAVDAA